MAEYGGNVSAQGTDLPILQIDRAADFRAMSMLPPKLRELLGQAPQEISAVEVLEWYREHGEPAVIEHVEAQFRLHFPGWAPIYRRARHG